jgi:hypothetical protein
MDSKCRYEEANATLFIVVAQRFNNLFNSVANQKKKKK